MRSIVVVRAAIIVAVVLANVALSTAFADTAVVSANRMIDVLTGRIIDHPQITITDGRIATIGPVSSIPTGARRVELKGMTLLPGLIDMHTHLTSDPHYSGYRRLQFTDNFWTVVGVANAKKTVEAGFTTVRNADVSQLQSVVFVMKGGEIVKAAGN
jgi:imidazolonepropionase-like amidohydrolase